MRNNELLQSYKLTVSTINTATNESGRFVQRFMAKLVELMGNKGEFRGGCVSDVYGNISPEILNPEFEIIRKIQLPLQSVMLPGAENWSTAKKAILSMQQAVVQHIDIDPKTKKERWQSFQFLGFVEVTNGMIEAIVHPKIWKIAKDFSMGFRAIEIEKLFGYKSIYAMKLYPLLSRQKNDIIMSISDFKIFLGAGDKYEGRVTDFIKRCVIPAKEELDEKGPYSFKYELLKTKKGKGRPLVTAIRLFPYKVQVATEESKLLKPIAADYLSRNVKYVLINTFNIGNLNQYKKLFTKASEVLDIEMFTAKLQREMDRLKGTDFEIENPAGWYIYRLTETVRELALDKN